MIVIAEITKNEKSLTNTEVGGDILVNDATMTVDEAERPVDAIGYPLTKKIKNEKSLANASENI